MALLRSLLGAFFVIALAGGQGMGQRLAEVEVNLLAYPDLGTLGSEVTFNLLDEQSQHVETLKLQDDTSRLVGRLRYGIYTLSVLAPGFVGRSVVLKVWQPSYRTFLPLTIGQTVGYDSEPNPYISISIDPALEAKYQRLWVRVIPLGPPSSRAEGGAELWLAQEWNSGSSNKPIEFYGLTPFRPYLVVVTGGQDAKKQIVIWSQIVETSLASSTGVIVRRDNE